MTGGSDTRNASSVATDKTGAGGVHGERPEQRGRIAGRQENSVGESLGVRGYDRSREASILAHKSLVVGGKEGGRKASGVAENPQGYRQGLVRGVESP